MALLVCVAGTVVINVEATTVLWLEHWPGNLRVPGSMPSTPNSVVAVSLSKELYSNCSPVPQ